MKTTDIKTKLGLTIYKGTWDGARWTLTGFPKKELIGYDYNSAYDFEDCVNRNVNCKGIDFDSESSQFFAYAKTKARIVSFSNQIEKHYEKAKKMMEEMY